MRFKKSLNNNIALAEDAEGCEVIVIGTGVGFKKVKGQPIEQSQIQKTFRIGSNDKYQRVEQFLSDIPPQVIDITDQIIEEGREIIGKKLNDSILLTLADHIHFALDRFKKEWICKIRFTGISGICILPNTVLVNWQYAGSMKLFWLHCPLESPVQSPFIL